MWKVKMEKKIEIIEIQKKRKKGIKKLRKKEIQKERE